MKQIVGRVVSEVLWYLGDWVSQPMCRRDWAWIYPVYNWLMDSSHQVQVWAGISGPWDFDTIKDKE